LADHSFYGSAAHQKSFGALLQTPLMKTQKKIQKLSADIERMETALRDHLSKKLHNKNALNLSEVTTRIYEKRQELDALLARN
jgi:hypothetical protein